jgi:chemotaxis protein MotB
MTKVAPIIIKKKRGGHGHGGHHGGAWKVAYADFVTAMMAFFLVMWILGLSDSEKKGIAQYFREPGLFEHKIGKGLPIQIQPSESSQLIEVNSKSGENCTLTTPEGCPGGLAKNYQMANLGQELKDQLEAAAQEDPELKGLTESISVELTKEGLRIEMMDSERSTFFQVGGARPSKAAIALLQKIASQIKSLPHNKIEVEGHTDRRPYPSNSYTNWDLSTERANAARRILENSGVKNISQVSGLADTRPLMPTDPYDLTNRRVSILVRQ